MADETPLDTPKLPISVTSVPVVEPHPLPVPETPVTTPPPPVIEPDAAGEPSLTEDQRVQMYSDQRNKYAEGARDAYSDFHKGLLAAAGGIILLSFTGLKDIGHAPESLNWLLASWIMVVVTGASALIALLTSAQSDRERMKQLDSLMTTGDSDETLADRYGKITIGLNLLASIACVSAILFFGEYLFINVRQLGGVQWQQSAQAGRQENHAKPPAKQAQPAPQPKPTPTTASQRP